MPVSLIRLLYSKCLTLILLVASWSFFPRSSFVSTTAISWGAHGYCSN